MAREFKGIAELIQSRDEPLKTLLAALVALIIANVAAICANWGTVWVAGGGFLRDQATNGVVVFLLMFLWTAASVVLGGYIVARFHDTRYAVGTFIVLELLFGAGLLAEFWTPAIGLLNTTALLLVIPCAILGVALAPPRGLKWMTRPPRQAKHAG